MMIYRNIEARCPRCFYSANIREDAIALYERKCPSCGYPSEEEQPVYKAEPSAKKPRKSRKVMVEEEWLMDIP